VHPDHPDLPPAPPLTLSPGLARQPMDNALRLVITLMFVNLGLSVALTALMLIFHTSIVNYELAHTPLPAGTDPAAFRDTLQAALWGRLAGVVVLSALYVWRSFSLRAGKRRAYIRLIWICAVGLAGIVYLIAAGHYPAWMRVEQAIQGAVLIALLIAVTRGPVRDRFAKQQPA
jgi:uncharacterized membrane protein